MRRYKANFLPPSTRFLDRNSQTKKRKRPLNFYTHTQMGHGLLKSCPCTTPALHLRDSPLPSGTGQTTESLQSAARALVPGGVVGKVQGSLRDGAVTSQGSERENGKSGEVGSRALPRVFRGRGVLPL